jgi:hypothetical protein
MASEHDINRNEGQGAASGRFAAHNRTGDRPGNAAPDPIADEVCMEKTAAALFALLVSTPFKEFQHHSITIDCRERITLDIQVGEKIRTVTLYWRYGGWKPVIDFIGVQYTHDSLDNYCKQYNEWQAIERKEQQRKQVEEGFDLLQQYFNNTKL